MNGEAPTLVAKAFTLLVPKGEQETRCDFEEDVASAAQQAGPDFELRDWTSTPAAVTPRGEVIHAVTGELHLNPGSSDAARLQAIGVALASGDIRTAGELRAQLAGLKEGGPLEDLRLSLHAEAGSAAPGDLAMHLNASLHVHATRATRPLFPPGPAEILAVHGYTWKAPHALPPGTPVAVALRGRVRRGMITDSGVAVDAEEGEWFVTAHMPPVRALLPDELHGTGDVMLTPWDGRVLGRDAHAHAWGWPQDSSTPTARAPDVLRYDVTRTYGDTRTTWTVWRSTRPFQGDGSVTEEMRSRYPDHDVTLTGTFPSAR